ncbi:MAG: hypothetical protein KC912_01145 [Proteobacteria bacterium]|nr:hypothetical protein [Pseudomonadota bacterium]
MRKPITAVLVVVFGLLVSAWFLVQPTEPAAQPAAPEEARRQVIEGHAPVASGHDHEHTAAETQQGRVGDNGMPIADDAPVKTAGFPKVEPVRPLDSPGDWVGVRAEAHEKWVRASMDALEIYGDREQLSESDYAALQASFGQLHSTVEETRRSIEAGEMLPAEGREVMKAARETVASELTELFGEHEMEMLRLEMVKRVPAGGF